MELHFYPDSISEYDGPKTFNQVLNDVACLIIKHTSYHNLNQGICDEVMDSFASLRYSLYEWINQKSERDFEDLKCSEITVSFMASYKNFLLSQGLYPNGDIPAITHFQTIGEVLYLSSEHGIFDWDKELLRLYKGNTPSLI